MTDQQIDTALKQLIVIERDARAHWQAPGTPVAEQQAALSVVRHATATMKAVEQWIAVRQPATTT